MLGQACIDITSAIQLAMSMGQTVPDPPAPASCTPDGTAT
jgi:hypothetical protein